MKETMGKWNEPSPTIVEPSLHLKVMVCIWGSWKGILYYKLLPENQTFHSSKYCSQLDQLKSALEKRLEQKMHNFPPELLKATVSLMIGQKLLQLDWEVLIHPLHSPAIAPLGFYLFRSLQNSLNGKNFSSLGKCKRHLE